MASSGPSPTCVVDRPDTWSQQAVREDVRAEEGVDGQSEATAEEEVVEYDGGVGWIITQLRMTMKRLRKSDKQAAQSKTSKLQRRTGWEIRCRGWIGRQGRKKSAMQSGLCHEWLWIVSSSRRGGHTRRSTLVRLPATATGPTVQSLKDGLSRHCKTGNY